MVKNKKQKKLNEKILKEKIDEILFLKEKKYQLLKEYNLFTNNYKDKFSFPKESSKWIEKLSIESLHDVNQVENDKKNNYILHLLNEKEDIKNIKKEKYNEIMNLKSEIFIKDIDYLLYKIKIFEDDLDSQIESKN